MWAPDSYIRRLYEQTESIDAFPTNPEEPFAEWQHRLRGRLLKLLGSIPEHPPELRPVCIERKTMNGYTRERVEFTTFEGLRMPAYVLIPNGASKPLPAVVACHGHGYGSKEIVGLMPDGSENTGEPGIHRNFAVELVKRGFLVIAPEYLGFGDRRLQEDNDKPPTENSCYRLATMLMMLGQTLAGHRIYETMRAIDYLSAREEADKIGCMGFSGGGLVAAFTAALDERIGATVVSGYANTFKESIMAIRHCLDNYIPGILPHSELPDIVGLIAPRPLLIESGKYDHIFPFAAAEKAFQRLKRIYRAAGADHLLENDFFEGKHEISGLKAYDWLKEQIG